MEKIDEYITEARDDIQGKEEYVNGLQEIYKKAQEDYEKDKQTFTEAQNCFESYKKRPQEIKDDLKKLTDMRDTIKANDDAQKEGYLLKNYFWITQLIDGNEELKIETPTEFKNKYTCYWCEMEEAQEKSRASEKEMTKAKEKYEQENEILTKMNDNFASDILEKIKKIPISDCLKTQTCQTSKD
jgi:ribosomal protein S1